MSQAASTLGTAILTALVLAAPATASEMHELALAGDDAAAKALVRRNPKLVKATDEIGQTPLHCAARKGHDKVAAVLLAAKADVNRADIVGWTALHCAASAGHSEVVKMLLERRAAVDPKDLYGSTPLDRAIAGGHAEVAKALIEKGATSPTTSIPKPGEVDDLIAGLGSVSWHEREAAQKRLVELRFFVVDAVEAATTHKDAEIVWRAKKISSELKKTGYGRTLSRDWWLVGPFPHPEGKEPLNTVYGPETKLDADPDLNAAFKMAEGEARWCRPWPKEDGDPVDLDKPWGDQTNTVAYGITWVFCPEDRDVTMLLGTDDSTKVWINGALIHTNDAHRPVIIDNDKVEVRLKKGWNRLFIKVVEYAGHWGFCCRFVVKPPAVAGKAAPPSQLPDIIFDATRGGAVKGPEGLPDAMKEAEEKQGEEKDQKRPAPPAPLVPQQLPVNRGAIQINFGNARGAIAVEAEGVKVVRQAGALQITVAPRKQDEKKKEVEKAGDDTDEAPAKKAAP